MRGIGSSGQPVGADVARINALAGAPAVRFRRAVRGYSPAERWSVALADGRRVFARSAATRKVYAALAGDFMPAVRGWDDGARPLLLLEDLSDCRWPPPWDAAGIDQVLAALARLRAADPSPTASHRPAMGSARARARHARRPQLVDTRTSLGYLDSSS